MLRFRLVVPRIKRYLLTRNINKAEKRISIIRTRFNETGGAEHQAAYDAEDLRRRELHRGRKVIDAEIRVLEHRGHFA